MPEQFDLVVIGSGPAGEKGAAQAAYFGKRVAVVEQSPEPGGAAVHTGTLPSKTLRETALYLSGYRSRDLYGISMKFDNRHAVPHLIARKDAIVETESRRIRENLARHDVTYFHGHGHLVGPHAVAVDGATGRREIVGDVILVATGSRPHRPDDIPFDGARVFDSDEILGLARVPPDIVVLGGGVIGCEYACMLAALGVAVTVVDVRERILPFLDEEMNRRLREAMSGLGIDLKLGRRWSDVAVGDRVTCELDDGSSLEAHSLLFAAGRSGNTAGLGLEAVGVTPDRRGYVPVDESFRTTADHVFAAGDVVGFPALASVSMEQGRVAMCHAFGFEYKRRVSELLPYGIYTIPEVSFVGATEEGCREQGIDYVVGRALYKDNARGQITGDSEGMTKLVVGAADRKVLGIHVIGERATELVHVGQAVMLLGGTVDCFIDMVFNFPTLAESYKYAAYDALGALARLR